MSLHPTPVGDLWVRRLSAVERDAPGPGGRPEAGRGGLGGHGGPGPSERGDAFEQPPDPPRRIPLVALHGFSQHGACFVELAEHLGRSVVAPDLPGHGRTEIVPTIPGAVTAIVSLLEALGRPLPLLGYSQGGRIALHVGLERPDLLSRLILVSASPGIEEVPERATRRERDEAWAHLLETEGMDAFLDRWLALPLFAGLERRGGDWRRRDRALRAENHPLRLAAALRGMGQGVQRYLGDRLGELSMSVVLVVGEDDRRYVSLAGAMAERIPAARLEVVPGAGHSVVGEDPAALARAVGG